MKHQETLNKIQDKLSVFDCLLIRLALKDRLKKIKELKVRTDDSQMRSYYGTEIHHCELILEKVRK